jgi:hypothetical protein
VQNSTNPRATSRSNSRQQQLQHVEPIIDGVRGQGGRDAMERRLAAPEHRLGLVGQALDELPSNAQANRLLRQPEIVALSGVFGVGAGAVLNTLRPHAASCFAVFGAGAGGLSALMAAKIAGCEVRWTGMPRGGHFAALEQPDLLLVDIRAFVRGAWTWRRSET